MAKLTSSRYRFAFALLSIACVFAPPEMFRFPDYVIDVAHFIVMKHAYDGRLANLSRREPRIYVFPWRDLPASHDAVVYDESDQIWMPSERRSDLWRRRVAHTRLACKHVEVRPLFLHYYLGYITC